MCYIILYYVYSVRSNINPPHCVNNKEITFNGVSTINNIPQIKSDQLLTVWYAETVISRRHVYLWTAASPDSRSRRIKFTQARVSRFHSMRRSTISKSKNRARNYFPLRFGVKFDRNQFVLVTVSARRADNARFPGWFIVDATPIGHLSALFLLIRCSEHELCARQALITVFCHTTAPNALFLKFADATSD